MFVSRRRRDKDDYIAYVYSSEDDDDIEEDDLEAVEVEKELERTPEPPVAKRPRLSDGADSEASTRAAELEGELDTKPFFLTALDEEVISRIGSFLRHDRHMLDAVSLCREPGPLRALARGWTDVSKRYRPQLFTWVARLSNSHNLRLVGSGGVLDPVENFSSAAFRAVALTLRSLTVTQVRVTPAALAALAGLMRQGSMPRLKSLSLGSGFCITPEKGSFGAVLASLVLALPPSVTQLTLNNVTLGATLGGVASVLRHCNALSGITDLDFRNTGLDDAMVIEVLAACSNMPNLHWLNLANNTGANGSTLWDRFAKAAGTDGFRSLHHLICGATYCVWLANANAIHILERLLDGSLRQRSVSVLNLRGCGEGTRAFELAAEAVVRRALPGFGDDGEFSLCMKDWEGTMGESWSVETERGWSTFFRAIVEQMTPANPPLDHIYSLTVALEIKVGDEMMGAIAQALLHGVAPNLGQLSLGISHLKLDTIKALRQALSSPALCHLHRLTLEIGEAQAEHLQHLLFVMADMLNLTELRLEGKGMQKLLCFIPPRPLHIQHLALSGPEMKAGAISCLAKLIQRRALPQLEALVINGQGAIATPIDAEVVLLLQALSSKAAPRLHRLIINAPCGVGVIDAIGDLAEDESKPLQALEALMLRMPVVNTAQLVIDLLEKLFEGHTPTLQNVALNTPDDLGDAFEDVCKRWCQAVKDNAEFLMLLPGSASVTCLAGLLHGADDVGYEHVGECFDYD